MSEVIFRKAESADFSLISGMKKRLLLEEWQWDEETLRGMTENFVGAVQRGALEVYLAFCGNRFAGMGAMLILREETTLCDFYVLPEYRRSGIMHGLADSLIKEARTLGCERVFILVKEEHRAHWQSFGFHDLYEENDDGGTVLSQRMELSLK